jgi:hypothetical protein
MIALLLIIRSNAAMYMYTDNPIKLGNMYLRAAAKCEARVYVPIDLVLCVC